MLLTLYNLNNVLDTIRNSQDNEKKILREAMEYDFHNPSMGLRSTRNALRQVYGIDTFDGLLINWNWKHFDAAVK
jgi:hypothetical protein